MSASEEATDRHIAHQINPFETNLSPQMQNTMKTGKERGEEGNSILLSVSIYIKVMALFNPRKSMYVSQRFPLSKYTNLLQRQPAFPP